jgi:hemerythrin-like domain-containing protein
VKRSPELRDLSEDHHHGLVAARTLRLAAEGKRPLDESVAEFLTAWQDEIRQHFRHEEEVLLPEASRVLGADDARVARTLMEHVALRRMVRDLERASADARLAPAAEIGRALDDHIRFEERVLFPAIEVALAGEALAELGRELKATRAVPRACGLRGSSDSRHGH